MTFQFRVTRQCEKTSNPFICHTQPGPARTVAGGLAAKELVGDRVEGVFAKQPCRQVVEAVGCMHGT